MSTGHGDFQRQQYEGAPRILEHFTFDHLPEELQRVSAPFAQLAHDIASKTAGPETTTALRKLLEAKDCAVRAVRTEKR